MSLTRGGGVGLMEEEDMEERKDGER